MLLDYLHLLTNYFIKQKIFNKMQQNKNYNNYKKYTAQNKFKIQLKMLLVLRFMQNSSEMAVFDNNPLFPKVNILKIYFL